MTRGIPPRTWAQSHIRLVFKAGQADSPGNFRPLGMGNTLGKVYHLILAKRMTSYLLSNGLIDKTSQKAFLPKVSGCTEHARVLSEVIKSARLGKKNSTCSLLQSVGCFRDSFPRFGAPHIKEKPFLAKFNTICGLSLPKFGVLCGHLKLENRPLQI
jgi:hypothetical protein